jgi:hypothetical protein
VRGPAALGSPKANRYLADHLSAQIAKLRHHAGGRYLRHQAPAALANLTRREHQRLHCDESALEDLASALDGVPDVGRRKGLLRDQIDDPYDDRRVTSLRIRD